jgi:hypothetical protein
MGKEGGCARRRERRASCMERGKSQHLLLGSYDRLEGTGRGREGGREEWRE